MAHGFQGISSAHEQVAKARQYTKGVDCNGQVVVGESPAHVASQKTKGAAPKETTGMSITLLTNASRMQSAHEHPEQACKSTTEGTSVDGGQLVVFQIPICAYMHAAKYMDKTRPAAVAAAQQQ